MIRTAIGIGILALLAAAGVLAYRKYQQGGDPRDILGEAKPPAIPPTRIPETSHVPAPAPNVEVPAPAAPNPPSAQPAPSTPNATQLPPLPDTASGKTTYKVRSGDSLWEISRRTYGSPDYMDRIAEANNMKVNGMLRVGQVLVLPDLRGGRKLAPLDADHEGADTMPERTETGSGGESEIMPPTLSHPVPRN